MLSIARFIQKLSNILIKVFTVILIGIILLIGVAGFASVGFSPSLISFITSQTVQLFNFILGYFLFYLLLPIIGQNVSKYAIAKSVENKIPSHYEGYILGVLLSYLLYFFYIINIGLGDIISFSTRIIERGEYRLFLYVITPFLIFYIIYGLGYLLRKTAK